MLSEEIKHKIYKHALEKIQSNYDNKIYDDCLCGLIVDALMVNSIPAPSPYKDLYAYTEIWRYKPLYIDVFDLDRHMGYWYRTNRKGCEKRIKVLKEAVKSTA